MIGPLSVDGGSRLGKGPHIRHGRAIGPEIVVLEQLQSSLALGDDRIPQLEGVAEPGRVPFEYAGEPVLGITIYWSVPRAGTVSRRADLLKLSTRSNLVDLE